MLALGMAVPVVQYTPVLAPKGKRVHAATLSEPTKTACGKSFSGGWRVALNKVNCHQCKLAIVMDCRPPKKRKKKKPRPVE